MAEDMGISIVTNSILEKDTIKIQGGGDEWKNELHFPGPILTDEQLEELSEEMNVEEKSFSLDEAKTITLKNLADWKSTTPSK